VLFFSWTSLSIDPDEGSNPWPALFADTRRIAPLSKTFFYDSMKFILLPDSTPACEGKLATLRRMSSACRTRRLRAEYAWPDAPSMNTHSSHANSLFTIGHSNLELEVFLAVLAQHRIRTLCDVRSRPASFRFPQFNRESLESGLASAGIRYEFLGETLGGRPSDPRVYREDGLVDYAARRRAPDFAEGIDRALAHSRTHVTALMCAEEDPLQCHRFLMICPALLERGVTPAHIRRGGVLESQSEAEDRLLVLHGFDDVTSTSLFVSGRDAALRDALVLQSKDFAFRASPETAEYF
jgi:hypothetical protein